MKQSTVVRSARNRTGRRREGSPFGAGPAAGALTLVVAGLFLFSSLSFAAEVYTWTDENGIVHFSDSPREGGEMETRQVDEIYRPGTTDAYPGPSAPAEAASASGPASDQAPKSAAQSRRDQMAKDREQQREQQAETDRLCEQHRQRLEQMEPSRRVFYENEQGETIRMDDEQRVQLVEESRAFISTNCR